ncbi:Transmembrane protein 63C [Cyanidiococcus yangmingshanensis]|uniref:Transmembrane protein 63C n=1 Tax=Cyanidiococcus yangmingshanensis TaxID=2690220 RepID=A0A7J7IIQ6_9RHOD|nr:Transmembrane protein 63C [Cyanidiococcus yangmingshanensis]
MRIPLTRWRWTLHPGMQRRLCEQWRQTELARLSRALERLQVEPDPRMTSTDRIERFSGWVLVRFRDPCWCEQCFRDFGPSSARLVHVENMFSWHRYRAHNANDNDLGQALLDAPISVDGGEAGTQSLTCPSFEQRAVPSLSDIQWSHLGMPRWERWLREGALNLLFGLVLTFLSSPVAILSVLQVVTASAAKAGPASLEALVLRLQRWPHNWSHRVGSLSSRVWVSPNGILLCGRGNVWRMRLQQVVAHAMVASDTPTIPLSWSGVFLFSYLPVGLLMLINNAVPWMLRVLVAHEGHPTRSAEETSVLRKSIAYYLLNTLFLPSSGHEHRCGDRQMPQRALAVAERIFRGDNAFFYANFLIQLALTGNTLALLHPLHWHSLPLALAEACQAAPFDYPYAYAQVIKVLSIGFFLGPFVPLLWPFIWLYLVTRYAVDRYNLRWVHPPSHTDERISRAATNAASAVLVSAISILMLLSWLYDNFMLLGILFASLLYLMSVRLSMYWYPRALRPFHRILGFLPSGL